MNIGLICFSDAGAALAQRLCEALKIGTTEIHTTEKYAVKYGFTAHGSIRADMETLFHRYDALIFIGACGIAVREIAPHVKDKTTDPAVLVIDDKGQYVIPILSGHIGGANALAKRAAGLIGAVPVVTTATDVNGKFSCDVWATEHSCAISSMQLAKDVSAAILTKDLPVASEFPLPELLPGGLYKRETGDLGVYIGVKTVSPFAETLRLIPRIVTLGVGCRKNMPGKTITETIKKVLSDNQIDISAICRIASIDVKKDEAGLLFCAEKLGVPTVFYSVEELNAVPGEFEESAFVKQTVGVGNVCERAALRTGGKLLVRKTAISGVTVAAAMEDWSVTF